VARSQNEPRRILVVRNDRLGDLVLSLPAIEAVRRRWPQAHLSAMVSGYAGPLLTGGDTVDELIVDDPRASASQLARRLAKSRFDAAVVLNHNTRSCLAVWLARVPERVCWANKPAGFLCGNRRVALRRSHPPVHESQFAMAFVERLGCPPTKLDPATLAPRLHVDLMARARVAARIERELGTEGPLFGVHPFNGGSAYNWPLAHYWELIRRLAPLGRVMVTGQPSERPLLDLVRDKLPAALRARIGFFTDFTLAELVAALGQQTVLTVSSTGPMHVAAVLGTPVVALFSPHPAHVPAKWAPLGANHTLLVAPLEAGEDARVPSEHATAVMARIGVDEVLSANLKYAAPAQPGNREAA
jgi:ADP-heptose:LPS heptosyltransferase